MIHLSEPRTSDGVPYTEHWHVPPPDDGARYTVTQQEWTDDYNERHIYAYELVP